MIPEAIGQLTRVNQTDSLTGQSFLSADMEGVDQMSRALITTHQIPGRWKETFGQTLYNDLIGLLGKWICRKRHRTSIRP